MSTNSNDHRPRVLTGLRANSSLTIANYLGAMLPMANLAKKHKDTHDFFMFVPDLHSFTTPIDHDTLYQNAIQNLKFYVAAGAINLKSENVHVYRQSYVPQHSELTWILDCFTYMGELSRMTQFKDKAGLSASEETNKKFFAALKERALNFKNDFVEGFQGEDFKKTMLKLKNESISAGLLNYPVLMAADILLYNAKYIPLGDDQKQHLELTRDVAIRINEKFKDVYPEGVFTTVPVYWKAQLEFSGLSKGLRIRSLKNPNNKMSKSDSDTTGFITLLDSPEKAYKKIMAATTDSKGVIRFDWYLQPGVTNLLQMLALFQNRDIQEIVTEWQGKTKYGELKKAMAEEVSKFLTDFQAKFNAIDEAKLLAKLENDEAYAREIAGAQLLRVQQAVGLRPRP